MSKRSSKQSSSSPVVRFLKEWGLFSIIVGLIIASRIYLWAPVKVDGHSMDPTLADSEYLLVVNHLSIDRFDIVVASEKDDDGKTKDIVKRVIGLPGETVEIWKGEVYIDGQRLPGDDSYGKIEDPGLAAEPFLLGEDEYFVLGDNRNDSIDSREPEVGAVRREDILGRAVFRVWPLTEFGFLSRKRG